MIAEPGGGGGGGTLAAAGLAGLAAGLGAGSSRFLRGMWGRCGAVGGALRAWGHWHKVCIGAGMCAWRGPEHAHGSPGMHPPLLLRGRRPSRLLHHAACTHIEGAAAIAAPSSGDRWDGRGSTWERTMHACAADSGPGAAQHASPLPNSLSMSVCRSSVLVKLNQALSPISAAGGSPNWSQRAPALTWGGSRSMRAAGACILLACALVAAATTIEPDRPVWPEEFEVGRLAAACRRPNRRLAWPPLTAGDRPFDRPHPAT